LSLKSNIEMVKEELNSEEKFFEKAVITEKFVKKYKNTIIAVFVVAVLFAGANIAYDITEQNRVSSVNKALLELEKDPKKSSAVMELKTQSPVLYDVWVYSQAVANNDGASMKELKNSKSTIIADLATYETAKDIKSLEEYSLKQGGIYRDLALVQSAIFLINDNKIEKAHRQLEKISADSALYRVASALLHYGVK